MMRFHRFTYFLIILLALVLSACGAAPTGGTTGATTTGTTTTGATTTGATTTGATTTGATTTGATTTGGTTGVITTPATTSIIGSVGDGPVIGANISVTDATGIAVNVGVVTSDIYGRYQMNVPTTAVYPLTVTSTGGIDQTLVAAGALSTTAAPFTAILQQGDSYANVSPLSMMVHALAIQFGGITAINISNAYLYVSRELGLGLNNIIWPTGTRTSKLNFDPSLLNATQYAALLQANEVIGEILSRAANIHAGIPKTQIINDIALDLVDGQLNGSSGTALITNAALMTDVFQIRNQIFKDVQQSGIIKLGATSINGDGYSAVATRAVLVQAAANVGQSINAVTDLQHATIVSAVNATQANVAAVGVNTVNLAFQTTTAKAVQVLGDGTESYTVFVDILNAQGRSAANQFVNLTYPTATNTNVRILTVTNPTNVNGRAEFTVLQNTTVNNTVNITATVGIISSGFTGLAFVACGQGCGGTGGGGPLNIIVTPAVDPVPADGSNLTVGVNTTPGNTVSLARNVGTISFETITPVNGGVADVNGLATFLISDLYAETINLTAKDAAGNSAPLNYTFIPAVGQISVVASPSTVPADGTASNVTVTLKTSSGQGVAGEPVAIFSTGSALAKATAVTNALGTVSFPVTDTVAEMVTVTVKTRDGGKRFGLVKTQTAMITFNDIVADVVFSSSKTNLAADGITTTTLLATPVNVGFQPLSGRIVTFTTTTGTLTDLTGVPLVSGQVTTDAVGKAQALLKSNTPTTLGSPASVSASAGLGVAAVSKTVSVDFTKVVNFVKSRISVNPAGSVAADGLSVAMVQVKLVDTYGRAIEGKSVTFADNNGSSSIFSASAVKTDVTGVATVNVTNIVEEQVDVYARVDSLIFIKSIQFQAAVSQVSLSSSSNSLPTNSNAIIIVKVLDARGVGLANRSITLSATGDGPGTASILPSAVITDGSGTATALVTNTNKELVSVNATSINGVSAIPALVNFTAPVSSMTLTIQPAGGAVPADGQSTATVVVNVKDVYGSPIVNQNVVFSDYTAFLGQSSAAQLSASNVTTDATGTAQITVVNPVAGTVTIKADADGNLLTGQINFALTNLQMIITTPNAPFLANGTPHQVSILVNDQNGVPQKGQTLNLSTDSPTAVLSPTTVTTDISGKATPTLENSIAETVNLNITDATGKTAFSVPITFIAANADRVTLSSIPLSVQPDGISPFTMTATVSDVYGTVAPNSLVQFSTTDPYAVLSASQALTDVNGRAQISVVSNFPTVAPVTATLAFNPAAGTPSATTSVIFEETVTSVQVAVVGSQTVPVDAYVNIQATVFSGTKPISNREVSFRSSGSGVFIPNTAIATTDAKGVAVIQVTSAVAENLSVIATASGRDSVAKLVTFTPNVFTLLMSTSPASGAVAADNTSIVSVIVNVKDASGVPIRGQLVSFKDISVPASAAQMSASSVVTSASGTAVIQVISAQAGISVIEATAGAKVVSKNINFVTTTALILQIEAVNPSKPVDANNPLNPVNGVFPAGLNTYTVKVRAKDATGQALPGNIVSITSDSPTMTFDQPSQGVFGLPSMQLTTDVYGEATVQVANPISEQVQLILTGPAQLVSTQRTIQFVSEKAQTISIIANPASLRNDGTPANLIINVLDANGAAVPNAFVRLSKDAYSSALLTRAILYTDAQGTVTTQVSDQVEETASITATLPLNLNQVGGMPTAIASVSFGPAVTDLLFNAKPLSTQTNDGTANTINNKIALTATVLDNGRPLANRSVTFTTTGTAVLDTLSSKKVVVNTDAQGVALLPDMSNSIAEIVTVTASIDTFVQSLDVTFTPLVGTMTVTQIGKDTAIADGVSAIGLVVTVKDSTGIPIEGQEVNFRDSTGTAAQLSASKVLTDPTGTATIQVTTPAAGSVTVTVTAGNVSQAPVLSFSQQQTLQVAIINFTDPVMTNNISDNYGFIKLETRGTTGLALGGQVLTLGKDSGNLVFKQNPISSDPITGIAIIEVRNKISEAVNISITDATGALLNTIPLRFVADRAQAITLSSNTLSVLPDGVATATLTATVRDMVGAAVPNAYVEFTTVANNVVDPFAVLSIPSGFTDALGRVTATVSRSAASLNVIITASLASNIPLYNALHTTVVNGGVATLTPTQVAYHDGFQLAGFGVDTKAINFEEPVASITLETNLNNVAADGVTGATITATVRGKSGALLGSRPVIFTAAPAALTLAQVNTGTTGAITGLATTVVTHSVAEAVTVTATVGGLTKVIVINFAPVVNSVLLAKDPAQSGLKANGLETYNITAQALDINGTGIANAVITFSAVSTGITAITPSSGTTDGAGVLVATVSDLYTTGEIVNVVAEASQKLSPPLGLAFDPTSSTSAVNSLSVLGSQFSVLTDNSDASVISATVLDINKAVVPGVIVAFKANGGQLSAGTAITDLNGVAQVNLSSGTSDPSNRIITVTASVFSSAGGSFTTTTSVLATGTTLTLGSVTTGIDAAGLPASLTVLLKNAGGLPIAGKTVSLSYQSLSTAAPFSALSFVAPTASPTFSGTTNVSGQFVIDVYGVAQGPVNMIAAGMGATSSLIFNVSNTGGSFSITSPSIDPYSLSSNTALAIQVRSPNQSSITLATSFGTFENNLSVIDLPFPGLAGGALTWTGTATLTASSAGIATVQAFDRNDATVSDVITVAVSAPAANAVSISLQTNIGVLAPNTGAGGDTAVLTATVRDQYASPVGGAEVLFQIERSTGGGEVISPAIGVTDSYGHVVTSFISGVQSSGATGVNIKATVIQNGTPSAITNTANIVIGGTAASVVIGTGGNILELSVTEYQLPMSVMVADSNGNPVRNTQITLSVWPIQYSTGFWAQDIDGNWFPNITATLDNEDVNENLVIDAGEDINGDNILTPPSTSSGTIPAFVTTDANGVANFNLTYQKQSAAWIVARIRASILAQGSEAASSLILRLSASVADAGFLPDSPFSVKTSNVTMTPTNQMLPSGTSSNVEIQVKDARGIVVTNERITVAITGSATFDGYSVATDYYTDTNGIVNVVVQGNVAENPVLSVTQAGKVQTLTMYFGSEIRLFSQTSVVLADGFDVHGLIAQALDAYGNAIANMPISFKANSGGVLQFAPQVGVVTNLAGQLMTDASGVVRAVVADTFPAGETIALQAMSGLVISTPALQLPFLATVGVITTPVHLSITASQFSVKTGGADSSVISVTLQDDTYAVIPNSTVSFTTTGGLLTANSAVTDAYGQASVAFTAGTSNFSNRTEVITAKAAGNNALTASIPIVVSGSQVTTLSQQSTLTIGAASDLLTVTIQDSAGTAIYNELVDLYATAGINLSALSGRTNPQGQISVNVTGIVTGANSVTATALNAQAVQNYQVATVGQAFAITQPSIDSYAMSIGDTYTSVTVFAPVGINTIAFSASVGAWTTGTILGYVEVPVAVDRYARADLYSSASGIDVIQVFDVANPKTKATIKMVWSAPVNQATQMQMKVSTSSLLPSVVGGVQNQAQVTATVLDVYAVPVAGVGVTFAIQNATNSGEVLSNVFATTDVAGIAATTFTSGTRSSGTAGIDIVATVVSTTNVPIAQQRTNIIVGGTAGSVAIGYAINSIGAPTPATYSLPFTVLVSDSAGAAVAGAVVTLDLWPEKYMIGNWARFASSQSNLLCKFSNYEVNYAGLPRPTAIFDPYGFNCINLVVAKTGYTLGSDAYTNEDVNKNLIMDTNPAEDLNGDGMLTPGIAMAGAIPLTVTTDAMGLATFNLTYLRTYAMWVEDRITATTLVSGTETRSSLLFTLPIDNGAITLEGSPPNSSPFVGQP